MLNQSYLPIYFVQVVPKIVWTLEHYVTEHTVQTYTRLKDGQTVTSSFGKLPRKAKATFELPIRRCVDVSGDIKAFHPGAVTRVSYSPRDTLGVLFCFVLLSRTAMVKSVRKADWLVDTTWYHVVSTNQSALRSDFTNHHGEISAPSWLSSWYHVVSIT